MTDHRAQRLLGDDLRQDDMVLGVLEGRPGRSQGGRVRGVFLAYPVNAHDRYM